MPSTDVAIIGLACKFPTAAGPDSFWRLIRDGRENTQFAGEAEQFDADFFNVSPREACAMDPRQRLALELTWELFEDAFVVPETQRGEPVSVYLGAMTDDYAALTLRDLADNLDHHTFTGISRAMIANRISYAFGLQGASMTVDSGQSSSLVAVHLGCESVRTGQSPLAIAGGVHLNLADEIAMLEREFGAMSVSGHTYAFDRRADGYVRGEGAGLLLLKPLRAALDEGDRIHAVIRGSAVANAGHGSASQTLPSARGEADVIRRALADAGLEAADIDYVEAHGTGTKIGDAIEAQALGEVFGDRARAPVRLGSVKTNIGHAGGAAGVAGLLKAVLAIEHSTIPASLNHAGADPDTDLKTLGLQVNTAAVPWPTADHPRRAGVSSFGMGGTNAHLIVEQPPAQPETDTPADPDPAVPWVLSARSERALANQAHRLSGYLAERGELAPVDVAWSLVSTRTFFEHRAVVVGGDREALATGLAALAAGESRSGVAVGRATSPGKTVFVFPGQGSQWPGMGRQLYDRFAVFARAFDEAAAAVDGHARLPLREVMWGTDAELLQSTEFAQPALFVLGIALAALWESFGVTPDVVMGHSVGEIAAACVAGALRLPDAARLVVARGRLMAGLPAGGVMVAVGAGEAEVASLMDGGVSIAAVNGPHSVVLSGAQTAVGALADRLAQAGRRVHRLAVSHAFHSPLMEPMLAEFAAVAADIEPQRPRVELVSNLTGHLTDAEYGSAQYWVQHVRQPVRFFEGVRAAEAAGGAIFLELGPGAALTGAVDQSLSAERAVSLATMPKDRPETESALGAAGQLFTRGLDLDWAGVFAGRNARRVDLPTYGFVRERFWLGARPGESERAGTPAATVTRSPDLVHQLYGLPPDEQQRVLVELVCEHAAAVLGHPGGHAIDRDRAFGDFGFDSLIGVELRNRLTTHTGTALSRTLIFDYPTPSALADHLRGRLLHEDREESDDDKIWSTLKKIPVRELRRTGLLDKLLLLAGTAETPVTDANVSGDDIDSLSPDALIAMALNSADDEDIE